jgi:hypothetical protein
MSEIKKPEWIALQNKEWSELDGTRHRISDYDPILNYLTYSVDIIMPITNKHFHFTIRFTPLELTNSIIKQYTKIAKKHLLDLMLEELNKTK